jgi:DNA-binding transcriptional regulator LsrR (DeoR family)
MQKMNGKRQAEWRRNQVLELTSKGHSQSEISNKLQISISTISRDLSCIREEAKTHVRKYIDERLPEEYEKCLVGLTAILREAWITSQLTEDNREKIQALSLAKECYSMKLDLLTNATVVDDAIRFTKESQDKLVMPENDKESKEPDQKAEKEEQEGEGKIATTNKVF